MVKHKAFMCRQSQRAAILFSTSSILMPLQPSTLVKTELVMPNAEAVIFAEIVSEKVKLEEVGSVLRSRHRQRSQLE